MVDIRHGFHTLSQPACNKHQVLAQTLVSRQCGGIAQVGKVDATWPNHNPSCPVDWALKLIVNRLKLNHEPNGSSRLRLEGCRGFPSNLTCVDWSQDALNSLLHGGTRLCHYS